MYYSRLFAKTLRQPPKEADTVNHKLLTQAGFVDQLMAGVYTYLPLGLKVLNNISQVVREEMDAIGGQEVLMPILHPSSIWKTTGGWDKIDVLFKIQSRTKKEYALGQSEEEVITPLVMTRVNTYKDLPVYPYQIHWKYRDELRAKSGILRGKEFFMKDMYSFNRDQKEFEDFYAIAKKAYLKVFKRLGLVAKVTQASGGGFTQKISYEFMVLTDAGEDDILYCDICDFCINVEIAKDKEGNKCLACGKGKLTKARASEVGNVFDLGQKYVKDFDLTYLDEKGQKKYPMMGCYGIGISRLMGVIVEKFHDDKGIIWPEVVTPFKVHFIGLDLEEKEVYNKAETFYKRLVGNGVEVLFDERIGISAGQKFSDADLIGIPYRVVVSKKTHSAGSASSLQAGSGQAEEKIEVKRRDKKETLFLTFDELKSKLV